MRPQRFHVASHPQNSYISALFTFSLTNVSFSEKIFRRSFHLFNVQLPKFQVDPWNQHPFSYTGLECLIRLNIPVNWNRILFISTGRVIFFWLQNDRNSFSWNSSRSKQMDGPFHQFHSQKRGKRNIKCRRRASNDDGRHLSLFPRKRITKTKQTRNGGKTKIIFQKSKVFLLALHGPHIEFQLLHAVDVQRHLWALPVTTRRIN